MSSALDYLLKPIEPERLAAALQKVQAASFLASANGAPGTAGSESPLRLGARRCKPGSGAACGRDGLYRHDVPLEQLFVRDGPRCWFVPLREVSVFTAEGNYVRLQWGKAHPLLGRSLIALEEKLDARKFFRANRRQIVNLDFIENVELGEGGRLHVQLRDGLEIEIFPAPGPVVSGRARRCDCGAPGRHRWREKKYAAGHRIREGVTSCNRRRCWMTGNPTIHPDVEATSVAMYFATAVPAGARHADKSLLQQ